jgi:hypothetical protein
MTKLASMAATATSTSSCTPKTPLMELGTGNAAVLNYNLPQSSCFPANGHLTLSIPKTYWKDECYNKPPVNFYTEVRDLNEQELENVVVAARLAFPRVPFTVQSVQKLKRIDARKNPASNARGKDDLKGGTGGGKDDIKDDFGGGGKNDIKDAFGNPVSQADIADQINAGMQPQVHTNLYGQEVLDFVPEPIVPDPRLVICLQYRVCSFLGDYGAGSTIKTFSLLPGEKTEISVKTYKHLESVRKKAENVLDSFSESSTQELEKLMQAECKNTFQQDNTEVNQESVTEEKTRNWKVGGDISLTIPLKVMPIGVNANASGGGTTTTTDTESYSNTLTTNMSSMMDVLNRALDKHVSTSSAVREVSVNTEVTETSKEGVETSTTRTLENINKSRVLNFVFRQLLQEYITITYLEDVKFVYSNGYAETKEVVDITGLTSLLLRLFKTSAMADQVRDAIMAQLCNIADHEGSLHSFLEHVTEQIDNCCGSGAFSMTRDYCRKRKGLSQTFEGITVPGIITNVRKRILRTDSLISEALLGQGEALDCYNQKLQDAATVKAQLENRRLELENLRMEQAMQLLDLIPDPAMRAELYKKIFGDCCNVPQSGCGCASCATVNA